jgi:hypothetical protein
LSAQKLNAVADFIQMILDDGLRVGFLIGRETPFAANQSLRYRRQGLPRLVANNEAGLQIVADVGVMGDRVSVRFVGMFVTQSGPVMDA